MNPLTVDALQILRCTRCQSILETCVSIPSIIARFRLTDCCFRRSTRHAECIVRIAQIVGLRSLMLYKLVEHGSLDTRACFCVRTCVPYVRAMQMVSFELCTGDAMSSVSEWILKNLKGDKKEIKLCSSWY